MIYRNTHYQDDDHADDNVFFTLGISFPGRQKEHVVLFLTTVNELARHTVIKC